MEKHSLIGKNQKIFFPVRKESEIGNHPKNLTVIWEGLEEQTDKRDKMVTKYLEFEKFSE